MRRFLETKNRACLTIAILGIENRRAKVHKNMLNDGGRTMNQTNQVMESRSNEVIFFKSQEEFAKALREGSGSVEEKGLIVELAED